MNKLSKKTIKTIKETGVCAAVMSTYILGSYIIDRYIVRRLINKSTFSEVYRLARTLTLYVTAIGILIFISITILLISKSVIGIVNDILVFHDKVKNEYH